MSINRVLQKSIVSAFYAEHLGVIAFLVTVFFGFMGGAEHMELAGYFVSRPASLLFPACFWALVAVRVMLFNRGLVQRPEYAFLHVLKSQHRWPLVQQLTLLSFGQLAPVLVYGWFLVFVATRSNQWLSALLILILQFVLLGITAIAWARYIFNPHGRGVSRSFVLRGVPRLQTPALLFYARWALHRHGPQYLFMMISSILVIAAVSYLYTTDTYDYRFYGLTALAAGVLISQFAFLYIEFEFDALRCARHLPVSLAKRFVCSVGSMAILLLPIAAALAGHTPRSVPWLQTGEIILFLFALPAFFYPLILATRAIQPEQALPNIFFIGLVLFVSILSGIPMGVLAVLLFGGGWLMYRKVYYRFEWASDMPSDNKPSV